MNRFLYFCISLAFIYSSSHAQTPGFISLNEEITGTFQNNNAIEYRIRTIQRFVEVILFVENRGFEMSLEIRSQDGQQIDVNFSLNYPNFQGNYLMTDVQTPGTYSIRFDPDNVPPGTEYTLLAREHSGDEPFRNMALFQSFDGWIGPVPENDAYILNLRRGNTVMFTIATPMNILDSYVGILDPNGDAVAVNYDFFGTRSVVIYTPEMTGEHIVVVGGEFQESEGPYTIIANPVPSFSPPFTTDDELLIPGEVLAYQIPLKASETYDFSAIGVDGFAPSIALTDANQQTIAIDSATEELSLAFIPGFTPLFDESLYLFVMGSNGAAGSFNVTVDKNPDEANGIQLAVNRPFASEIGPIGDVDEYMFAAQAEKRYSIKVTPTWHFLDPVLEILDSDGNRLFYNDDSAEGSYSLLSDISFPIAGDYTLRVSSFSEHPLDVRKTGAYIIEIVEGSAFDQTPPRIFEGDATTQPIASNLRINIPTAALTDDTYPIEVQLINDRTQERHEFTIESEQNVSFDVPALPDDIFKIVATDSSAGRFTSAPIFIPGAKDIAVLEGLSFPMAIDRQNNIHIIDTNAGSVVRYNINGATQEIAVIQPAQGGILGPNSIAMDSEGTLFISNGLDHSISKILPTGHITYHKSPLTGLDIPVDLAFNGEGILYAAQTGADNIIRILPNDQIEVVADGIRNPNSIAFGPDGLLYIANADRGASGIYRVELDGSVSAFVQPFAETLQGMAFDSDGYLYAADGIAGWIYRVDPQGNVERFTRGLSGTVDLAFGYGEYSKTLFAANMGIESAGFFARLLIGIPAGRIGLPLPFSRGASIPAWRFHY